MIDIGVCQTRWWENGDEIDAAVGERLRIEARQEARI